MKKLLPILLSCLVISGCSVGPDYQKPESLNKKAHDYPFLGGADNQLFTKSPAKNSWWYLYNDKTINKLVDEAIASNNDLKVAIARMEKSRAWVTNAQSLYLPSTTVTAGKEKQLLPSHLEVNDQREYTNIHAGLDVSYEVDLFGRVRRTVEAANGDWQAAEADRDAVMVAVIAETVAAYVDAASTARRIAVVRQTVEVLDHSLRITSARVRVGHADRLDEIRLTSLRDQNEADLGPLNAQHDAALYRLAMLIGKTPGDLPPDVVAVSDIPHLSQPIPIGENGAELLARRPDVRAAERRLASDTAHIGIVTADLYPRIVFGGQIGTSTFGNSGAFGGEAAQWSLGGLVSWQFPNIMATKAKINAADAQARASLAEFDGTVLKALQETETALSSYGYELERNRNLHAAELTAAQAVDITLARQREGLTDFLSVLDAQRTLAEVNQSLAASDALVASNQIALFKALGGGWQTNNEQ